MNFIVIYPINPPKRRETVRGKYVLDYGYLYNNLNLYDFNVSINKNIQMRIGFIIFLNIYAKKILI